MGQAGFNFCNTVQLNKGKLHVTAAGQDASEGDKQMQPASQELTRLTGPCPSWQWITGLEVRVYWVFC